jgi:ribosomal protein S18 acetylase RimI-like enzyme
MPVDIRLATVVDADPIIALWDRCGLIRLPNDPHEDLALATAGPNSTVFVAFREQDGRIVGTIMVGHDGHRGNLYYLAVEPEARFGGLGRRLIVAAENWLRTFGIRKVHLLVLSDNLCVTPFYHKAGYLDAPATLFRKWLVS